MGHDDFVLSHITDNIAVPNVEFVLLNAYLYKSCLRLFAIAVAGALAGFLLYNKPKALVFMGDTGSLFLGGVVSAIAVVNGWSLYLVIAGLVYVIEALSVILQVTFFKLTGKRIFKMSPIHHHFEMCGWSEIKIDLIFCAVTAILCVIAYAGL